MSMRERPFAVFCIAIRGPCRRWIASVSMAGRRLPIQLSDALSTERRIMKVGMRRVRVLSAIMAVMALLVGMVLAGNAQASTDADEYIRIGNVEVARSLGVTTEAQLQQRYSEGYLSVDFNEKAEITAIRPLSAEEMKEMQLTENEPAVVNEIRR